MSRKTPDGFYHVSYRRTGCADQTERFAEDDKVGAVRRYNDLAAMPVVDEVELTIPGLQFSSRPPVLKHFRRGLL